MKLLFLFIFSVLCWPSYWNFLTWLWTSHKGVLLCLWLLEWHFCEGNDNWDFLFHHLANVSPLYLLFFFFFKYLDSSFLPRFSSSALAILKDHLPLLGILTHHVFCFPILGFYDANLAYHLPKLKLFLCEFSSCLRVWNTCSSPISISSLAQNETFFWMNEHTNWAYYTVLPVVF